MLLKENRTSPIHTCSNLALGVANVLFLRRIKSKVADRCYQSIDAKSDHRKEEVCCCSAGVAFGLKLGMIDDKATDPTQEEGQQKANEILVIHFSSPFFESRQKPQNFCLFDTFIVRHFTLYVNKNLKIPCDFKIATKMYAVAVKSPINTNCQTKDDRAQMQGRRIQEALN